MDLLPLHIEYLLTRHDCVIVPGIGAFIATETEASIDFDRGLISPRRREISFNGSVVTDDGLLSHSIARSEHVSYEEAHRLLSSLTEKMKSDLNNEGEASVGLVGKLIRDQEGFLNFKPRISSVIADIYPDAKIEAINAQAADIEERECETTVDVEADGKAENDGMRTIMVAPDRYVFTVSKRAVHVAAMLIMVFTVCLSLMIPMNLDNEQKASVISIEDFFRRPVSIDHQESAPSPIDTITPGDVEAIQ